MTYKDESFRIPDYPPPPTIMCLIQKFIYPWLKYYTGAQLWQLYKENFDK